MDASAAKDVNWQDITEEFLSSVKELNIGELLKCDQFTLLDAMGAIELMDPKTDSGMILKRCDKRIMNLEQSVKLGLVKVNNLQGDELIGIMDESYACLATWLEGHPLAQTVMTNLYLHEPERIEDRSLRVFSQALLRLVDCIDKVVATVYCIEEEDFLPNNGKFSLSCPANQISDQKVLNSLDDLCQQYERLLRDKRMTNGPKTTSVTDSNAKSTKPSQTQQGTDQNVDPVEQKTAIQINFDETYLSAILDRLRFTQHLFACFLQISRNILKNYWELNSQTDAQLLKTIKLVQQTASNCDQHLDKSLTFVERWIETIDIGIKPTKPTPDQQTCEADYPTIMGFEPFINHKMLPPAYPRCPSIKSRPDTVQCLKNLIIRMKECVRVSSTFNQRSFNKSLEAIEEFSRYFRPGSCVISRSFLQALYLPTRSIKLFKDELLQSMSEYCEPLILAMRKDEVRSQALDNFIIESSKALLQAVGLYGHNTARQQERFSELIVSFKNLQYSAFLVNTQFSNIAVYSWTTCFLARLCIKYVLSGLEIGLFSPHEFPYVFWYLYDILYRNEREQLEMAKRFIVENDIAMDENQKKAKLKKQRKKGQYSTMYHDKCLLCNDAFGYLTGGTFLLTYGLQLQGKIKSPIVDFTTEEICFDHRFGTITSTSVYQSYKNTLSRLEKLEYVYREALECFSEAKNLFEAIGNHESCLKVCKTNMIVAKILSSNQDSFANRNAEFCFDIHPSFPTVKF